MTPTIYDLDALLRQAEDVQKHLMEATHGNAPSLGYSIVLEELLQEVKRVRVGPSNRASHAFDTMNPLTDNNGVHLAHNSIEDPSASFQDLTSCPSDVMDAFANFPTDDDLWFALDSLPYSDYSHFD